MTLLAYDLDRLASLFVRMLSSAHELRSVRADDPAAADALRAVRLTSDELEITWLPLVRNVMNGNLLSGGRSPGELAQLDNSLAWVMANGYGWSVADDPLPDASMTVEAARALAVRLTNLQATTDDPAMLRWLAVQLHAIAADPNLSREFLANFDGWADWGDTLARTRTSILGGYPSDAVDVATIDSVFAALAGVQRAAGTDALPWIGEVMPYTAAMIVRSLDLDGPALAVITDDLLRRAAIGNRTFGPSHLVDGPNVGDLLLPLVMLDPAASREYALLAGAHPGTVFAGTHDRALAERVIIAGTDPAVMSTNDAGLVVPAFLRWSAQEQSFDAGIFLADLVTPWTFQFAAAVDDWPLDRDERKRLLEFVVSDEAALARLIDNSTAVLAGAKRSIGGHRSRRAAEYLSYVSMIGGITMNQKLQVATRRRRAWDLLCNVAGIAASLVPGAVVGATATVAVMMVQADAGPDLKRARADQQYAANLAQTMTAAGVLQTVSDQLRRERLLPENFPATPRANPHPKIATDLPSSEFFMAFMKWMDQLPGGWDGPVGMRVQASVYAVLGPWDMGWQVGTYQP